jgi:hypothetical protein
MLVMTLVLTTAVTLSTLVIRETRGSTRIVEAMRALAVADSGVERTLYLDLKVAPLSNGDVVNSNEAPFNTPGYGFSVQVTKAGGVTIVRSTGRYGTTQRLLESGY